MFNSILLKVLIVLINYLQVFYVFQIKVKNVNAKVFIVLTKINEDKTVKR